MFRTRSKEVPIGLFVGLIFGIVVVCTVFYFHLEKFYSLFPVEEIDAKSINSVILANKNLQLGHIITVDDLAVDNSGVYKNTGVDTDYLIGKKTKINISENMPITYEMVFEGQSQDATRLYEVSFLSVGNNINVGDTVDIRISFPNGDDFTVLSSKEVIQLIKEENSDNSFVTFALDEKDIVVLSSAYNDYRLLDDVNIYMAKYVDIGVQSAAFTNYPVNYAVADLIKNNDAILDKTINDNRDYIEKCFAQQLSKQNYEKSSEEDENSFEYELYDEEDEEDEFEF